MYRMKKLIAFIFFAGLITLSYQGCTPEGIGEGNSGGSLSNLGGDGDAWRVKANYQRTREAGDEDCEIQASAAVVDGEAFLYDDNCKPSQTDVTDLVDETWDNPFLVAIGVGIFWRTDLNLIGVGIQAVPEVFCRSLDPNVPEDWLVLRAGNRQGVKVIRSVRLDRSPVQMSAPNMVATSQSASDIDYQSLGAEPLSLSVNLKQLSGAFAFAGSLQTRSQRLDVRCFLSSPAPILSPDDSGKATNWINDSFPGL